MESLKKIIARRKAAGPVHARHEFQEFGIYLSEELHDPTHKSFYIKLAKEKSRGFLEEAKNFAKDYNTKSVNRGKLFMWKLKEMEKEKKEKTRKT
ncbi:MAG TPA: hypothetical protein VLE47_03155 [Candidatus Saccharimonadales bacterium]|nr:hypothetical protein [Candidatus Saccharimonadales bacterium]